MTHCSLHDLLHGAREGSCHAKPTIVEDIHGHFEPFSLLCYREKEREGGGGGVGEGGREGEEEKGENNQLNIKEIIHMYVDQQKQWE